MYLFRLLVLVVLLGCFSVELRPAWAKPAMRSFTATATMTQFYNPLTGPYCPSLSPRDLAYLREQAEAKALTDCSLMGYEACELKGSKVSPGCNEGFSPKGNFRYLTCLYAKCRAKAIVIGQ